jgi:hypothetical protein
MAAERRSPFPVGGRPGIRTPAGAGTVFHRTRTELTKWFLAVYLMGRDKRGVSAKFLQREFPEANLRSRTFHESILLG